MNWKSVGNHLEISWKSWKSVGNHLEISWKSPGNQLEISWKLIGNQLEISLISAENMLEISWKSVGNQLEISWKINCFSAMGHESNVVWNHEASWKLNDILEISCIPENPLEISWK